MLFCRIYILVLFALCCGLYSKGLAQKAIKAKVQHRKGIRFLPKKSPGISSVDVKACNVKTKEVIVLEKWDTILEYGCFPKGQDYKKQMDWTKDFEYERSKKVYKRDEIRQSANWEEFLQMPR